MNLRLRAARQPLAARRDGLLNSLTSLASLRAVSLALVAAVAVTDLTIPWHGWGFVPRALVDEPCHLATALVVLGAITRVRGFPPTPWFTWTMLSSSVLIDADHLPLEFGSSLLTAGTPRPYTHALWLAAVLTALALTARRWDRRAKTPISGAVMAILAGAAWGVSAHFLRDIATAPMSLWWPASDVAVQVPYGWYIGALVVIVAVPPVRNRSRNLQVQGTEHAAVVSGGPASPQTARPEQGEVGLRY
jgi:hypothetical protein